MTRQEAYIAELTQLLFYMTPWDKAEVLKGITAMVNHPETGLQTMEELGTPMKLAVTLHRQYTPTPEPTPEELAAKAAAAEAAALAAAEAMRQEAETVPEAEAVLEAENVPETEAEAEAELIEAVEEALAEEAEEAPVMIAEEGEAPLEEAAEEPVAAEEEVPAEEAAPTEEETPAEEEAPVEEETPVEEAPAEEEPAPAVEEAVEEASADEPAAEEEAPAEEAAPIEEEVPAEETAEAVEAPAAEEEEAPAEEESVQQLSLKYEDKIGQEKIFAEIFNAATEAQSAVPVEETPVKEVKRKARYLFLIPYILLAVVVGVPATLVFAVANVAVLAASLVSLCAVVYLVIFQFMTAAALAGKLIIIGLTLLMLAVTILLSVMTVWFLRTATIGFPRFLIEVAKTRGYREVEVQ